MTLRSYWRLATHPPVSDGVWHSLTCGYESSMLSTALKFTQKADFGELEITEHSLEHWTVHDPKNYRGGPYTIEIWMQEEMPDLSDRGIPNDRLVVSDWRPNDLKWMEKHKSQTSPPAEPKKSMPLKLNFG
jgi:hypothetical protein